MTVHTMHQTARPSGGLALSNQDLPAVRKPMLELAWSVLDAANDFGDSHTVNVCRRVIDADLRGGEPSPADLATLSAFFC